MAKVPPPAAEPIFLVDLDRFGEALVASAERSASAGGKIELNRVEDHRPVLRRFADAHGGDTFTVDALKSQLAALHTGAAAADHAGSVLRSGRDNQILEDNEKQQVRLKTKNGFLIDVLVSGIEYQREQHRAIHELQKQAAADPVLYAGGVEQHQDRMDSMLVLVETGAAKLHQQIAFIESYAAVPVPPNPDDDPQYLEYARGAATILRRIRDDRGAYPDAVVNHLREQLMKVSFPLLRNDTIADVNLLRDELRYEGSARLPRLPERSRHAGQIGPYSFD